MTGIALRYDGSFGSVLVPGTQFKLTVTETGTAYLEDLAAGGALVALVTPIDPDSSHWEALS